jgi:hypothetical protein
MDWQVIKHFGKVKYFNISYVAILLIPLVKEVFDRLNQEFGKDIYFIPYTVLLLYAASLFYALGIALYQFFCPQIIKSYDKIQDYIRDNMQIYLTAYPDLKLQIIRANLADIQQASREKIEALVNESTVASKAALEKEIELLLPSCVQHYLTTEYNTALIKYRLVMWISFLLYIIGTGIIVFLLFRKSCHVLFN